MSERTPPSIRRILVPTDLSPASDNALGHAVLLAARFGAHLTLYHALEVPGPAWVRAAGHEEELRRRLAAEARRDLERRARKLPGTHDVVVEPDVSAPSMLVDVALCRLVQATLPDLVVMATLSREAHGARFPGSVTQAMLRNAARPVLVVPPCCPAPAHGYARIVLPTDLSEASAEAFPMATLLGLSFQAEVVALHVVPRPLLSALADNAIALAAAVPTTQPLRDFVGSLGGARVSFRVEQGAAWERIVAVARDGKADLVIIATRGADSLGDRILGSQTERVISHAPCPVLAV